MSVLTAGLPGGSAPSATTSTVVVCGSRDFKDWYEARRAIVHRIADLPGGTRVVHGGARGTDSVVGETALQYGFFVIAIPARWNEHSADCWCRKLGYCREAGKRRNLEMLDLGPDLVIAFWNGSSTGTLHTISEARARGIPVEVIRP